MPNTNNQRRKSNASKLSGLSTAARRTPKGSKKEGSFGNAAVNVAISDITSPPTSSDCINDSGFGPVKWDNSTDFESVFSINRQDAFPHQSDFNPSSLPSTTTTVTPPGAVFEYTPESSFFVPAKTNPFNISQASRVSDTESPFNPGVLANNLFENTPSTTTIGNTLGQPTTNKMKGGTPHESTLPPGFASPEELDFLLNPRAALRHYGSVYLSGKNSGPRRSASFPKAFHSKSNSKPRPVTAAGPVQVTPALPQNKEQQTQEQERNQSPLNDTSRPLQNTVATNLPPPSTFSSSTEQKTSPEWLSTIHAELKSLTQHIKISGTGQQAKLYEIAALLVDIKKQQKSDSEALAKALQIKEDQNKKGLEGFVDDLLKLVIEVLLFCFLCIGILLQYQSYSFQAETSFSK
ncbi:hypothetical protein PISL3812_03088 [Talaromyces islandicus]|uniref:Uncharacterized protein n=1 Tax=Talaromyces islandicus TaxID=28573 RepID=A0A0U1LS31_TALIS|nr:hypothetical protein PISL3812_03088 [Talaromyces islandicus]